MRNRRREGRWRKRVLGGGGECGEGSEREIIGRNRRGEEGPGNGV